MPYLIDGHNLIPHIPGITLKDLEDEMALIHLLEDFARRERTRIEVYFDQAPPSMSGSRSFGTVRAHFISRGTTADRAIITRLESMGSAAKNWTVVTSDREILVEARSQQSKTLSSSEFASLLEAKKAKTLGGEGKRDDPKVSGEEVNYWLDQFERD